MADNGRTPTKASASLVREVERKLAAMRTRSLRSSLAIGEAAAAFPARGFQGSAGRKGSARTAGGGQAGRRTSQHPGSIGPSAPGARINDHAARVARLNGF